MTKQTFIKLDFILSIGFEDGITNIYEKLNLLDRNLHKFDI